MDQELRAASRAIVTVVVAAAVGCTSGASGRRSDAGTGSPVDAAGPTPPDAYYVPIDVGPLPDAPPLPGDADGDGIADVNEATYGTDAANPDSDMDGVTDGVEVLAGTDPTDPTSTIPSTDFYVVLPFEDPEQHRDLEFRARLGRADVFFLVDTTGSMGLAIANVRSSLSTTIVPGLADAIADLTMGVGNFRDFPTSPYGDTGDWSFRLAQSMTSDVSAVQTALGTLFAGGGGDEPEASTEALWSTVGGTCASGSGFGAACFRSASHPIVIHITDANFHNGPSSANDYTGLTAHTWTETLSTLTSNDVKVVGVAVSTIPIPLPIPPESRDDLEALATATSSRSSTGALTVYTAAAGAVSTSLLDGVADLVGAESQDVTARKLDDTTDGVDATQFIGAITPLRATRATRFDATTFYGVAGGTQVTFDVAFHNTTVRSTEHVQLYRAFIEVYDVASSAALDRRNVYIVIPREDGGLI